MSGGFYVRALPYVVTRWALRRLQQAGEPATLYIHPWELDPAQPQLDVPWTTKIRHYRGLAQTEARLDQLLREYTYRPIAYTIGQMVHP